MFYSTRSVTLEMGFDSAIGGAVASEDVSYEHTTRGISSTLSNRESYIYLI